MNKCHSLTTLFARRTVITQLNPIPHTLSRRTTISPATPFLQTTALYRSYHGRCPEDLGNIKWSLNRYPIQNGPWGFVVYRCSYKDEAKWQQMLQLIDKEVKKSLKLHKREDLLEHHQLAVIEDRDKLDRVTSHEVRDHFYTWAADEAMKHLYPIERSEKRRRDMRDPELDGILVPEATYGARYNFCLFVDDICLESLEHMDWPVVKLLWKRWGRLEPHERNYTVDPEWEDGTTEFSEEDVGWMYIYIMEYVHWYDMFDEVEVYYDNYMRPPMMMMERCLPGSWRPKHPGACDWGPESRM